MDAINGVANVYHPSRSSPFRSESLTGQLDSNAFTMTADTWPGFQVWNITLDASGPGATYSIADSDNGGSPGHAFWTSPYPSLVFAYNFQSAIINPAIFISIGITGGITQEVSAKDSAPLQPE